MNFLRRVINLMIVVIFNIWENYFNSVVEIIGNCGFSGDRKEVDNLFKENGSERG